MQCTICRGDVSPPNTLCPTCEQLDPAGKLQLMVLREIQGAIERLVAGWPENLDVAQLDDIQQRLAELSDAEARHARILKAVVERLGHGLNLRDEDRAYIDEVLPF